jgi:putative DNA primase/helicase
MTNNEKIELFKKIFTGRSDSYGAGECVKETVTDGVLKAHLTGRRRIGRYPLSPDILDGSGTLWVAADIDDDDLGLAIQVCEALEHIGIPCYIERSKSKGYHVWVFFSQPIEAKWARGLMKYAIALLERDTDYRIKEIFPKQNSIKQNGNYGFGNYIYLPLFGADVPNGRTVFLDSNNGYKPHPDQWAFLQSIERVTPTKIEELIEMGEIEPEEQADFEPEEIQGLGESPGNEGTTEEYNDMLPCVPKMMQGVSKGCRDVVAFTLAKHFRNEKKFPQEATLTILQMWNQKNTPPLENGTIGKKVASAYTGKGRKGYTSLGCDDDLIKPFCEDNCPIKKKQAGKEKGVDSPYFRNYTFIPKRLADKLMEENHFLFSGELLYVYRDGVFVQDAERFVKQQCRKKLGEEARVNRLNEVIAHISDMTYIEPEKLNTHTNLINLQNGMYNLIEGKLLPHNPEYLSIIRIPVEYNPSATCPTVDYFLESTLPADCVPIAEELFGYCLIPYVRLEKAFMFTGGGRNGKSTLLTLLEAFVGVENVSKIPLQEIDENRFKRAELFGKLVNLFADLDARALKSSTYFKTITSGDAIDAERKHKNPFSFRPFSRLAYSANQLPYSYDKSYAYYRRWIIIPFPKRFEGKNDDKSLGYKLTRPNELSGLLNRALIGLNRLFENQDFTETEIVKDAVENYQKQNDTVVAFVNDCCEFGESFETERSKIYDAYTTYCKNEGFEAESRIVCYDRIRAYPQVGEKKEPKTRFFTGIRIKQNQ